MITLFYKHLAFLWNSFPARIPSRFFTTKTIAIPMACGTAISDRAAVCTAPVPTPPRNKPLRIIQWADNAEHGARRIVMSGRFADICAELDRLAALENA